MRNVFFFVLSVSFSWIHAQQNDRISTLDFVEILNGNIKETHYYYENNWKKLREAALEKGYIYSFEILETVATDDAPFHLLLITTYANKKDYEKREDRFGELIEQADEVILLNEKKPTDFRRNVFNKEMVKHWNTKSKP